jgi:paraquat-inducible protein A
VELKQAHCQISSAQSLGLVGCHYCSQVNQRSESHCLTCGGKLKTRREINLTKCWALTVAATLLLIPANILPIMAVTSFGRGEPDTIISGIIKLFEKGLYPIGTIVFIASIMVPLLKLAGLYLLLFCMHGTIKLKAVNATRLYRWVELSGKWSMLDVFVVSLLVSLVDLGDIASVIASPGVTAFCAVVIMTMFAANSFDTRYLWDKQ